MAKHRIFLLDAFALLYRAHFAFIKNPRVTSTGMNTSAVFGFANTLLEILGKEDPSHLGVAFDTSGPTFRHEQFETYKGHREEMPEDLRAMIPYAHRLLKVLDIPILSLEGYEADDIIGTISAQADPDQYEVYMVTPDKDYAQLVKENVFMYKPQYRGGGYDVLGPAEVLEKFDLPPEKIIDLLGLQGDAADNIPGVPGIGPKSAVTLIKEFGTVEEIIANADNIKRKGWQSKIKEFGEQGLMSKELATIHCEVPFEWSYDSLKIGHANLEELMKLSAELELRTTTQRILASKLNPVQTGQTSLFSTAATGVESAADIYIPPPPSVNTAETEEHTYELLETPEKRAGFVKKAQAAGLFCFDTETTGLDPMMAELVGLALSCKTGEAYYVNFPEDKDGCISLLAEFDALWQDERLVKIGQNLKYDMLMLRNYGLEIKAPFFDTMLAHYVLTPESKHGMDAMAKEMLNYEPISIETLIGKKGKNQLSMREVELEKVTEYAAEDADITLQLYEKLAPDVKGNKVFETIEMPVMPILADLEFEGIKVDEQALNDYSEDLGKRLVSLEAEIYQLAGEEFNINSPRQLGVILFEKLELGKGLKAKKTKTGQYATNEQILTDLAVHHELPAQILAFRGLKKLKSTYVDALPKLINPKTGRVHTTFSQSVAVTGRLASVNPNLQNIPIRTHDGREVRKGFVPRDENHVLLSADYSQVELRIMAAMSGDPAMIEAFREGQDIHRATAAKVFGVTPEEVTPDQRSRAKTVNFGIIYGITTFGLSQRMGISRGDAKEIIETYFSQYPKVKEQMDSSIAFAKEHGYVETLFGRRRHLPDVNSGNNTVRGFAERNAINSPIQGSAADIIKLAMIAVYREMKAQNVRSRMLLQVHDELVFDVPRDEIELMKNLVKTQMENAVKLDVPLVVDVGIGENWLEAH